MDKLKKTSTVSLLTLREVPVAGFEIKLTRKWGKYIFLYFLPAGIQHCTRPSFVNYLVFGKVYSLYDSMIQIYIGLFVGVSSVSFLIPPTAYPARCGLLTTTLLVSLPYSKLVVVIFKKLKSLKDHHVCLSYRCW